MIMKNNIGIRSIWRERLGSGTETAKALSKPLGGWGSGTASQSRDRLGLRLFIY